MKVLVFTSLYPNNIWTHHGVFIKERMTQFARRHDCQVQVVAPVPYFPPIKISHRWFFSQILRHETIEGIEVHHPRYMMIPKIGMAFHGLLMFLSVLPFIKKLHKSFDFDLIDAHYVYPDGFAAVLLGHVFRKPVVVSARGSDINLYQTFPLIRQLLRATLRRADRVVAVSLALQEAIIQLGIAAEKITVIPNGVSREKFYPVPKKEARRQLHIPHKQVILSVGNLTANKGFDLLVKAFKMLCDERPAHNLYLVIVGGGEFRKKLENLVAALQLHASVRLVGDVPHGELYLWYSAADLFCLASRQEGWPNVLLESLACGTPVVATAVGGSPELIRSDLVGVLTERSEQALAKSIALALEKPWHAEAITQYASAYTWDQVAHAVGCVFASLLGLAHATTRPRGHFG